MPSVVLQLPVVVPRPRLGHPHGARAAQAIRRLAAPEGDGVSSGAVAREIQGRLIQTRADTAERSVDLPQSAVAIEIDPAGPPGEARAARVFTTEGKWLQDISVSKNSPSRRGEGGALNSANAPSPAVPMTFTQSICGTHVQDGDFERPAAEVSVRR